MTVTTTSAADGIRSYLKAHAQLAEMHPGLQMTEPWLLEHGKFYEAKELPEGWSYGRAKECYTNATHQVTDDDNGRYRYCEGYAYTPGLIACPHAWVVDTTDGRAIDVTWQDGGNQCGFCLGTGTWIDYDDEDSDTYGDEGPCGWCNGTGVLEGEHPAREGTAYFGVEIDREWLFDALVAQGHYGVLGRYATEHRDG